LTPRNLILLLIFLSATALSKPSDQGPLSFMQRDTNGDGRLTQSESGLSLAVFSHFDQSASGELSLGEFNDYWVDVAPAPQLQNVQYGEHAQQSLDLFLPEDPTGEVPLILWIHGGSWQRGSKRGCPFQTLISRGFAVASIDYRLAPENRFPAQLDDCVAALAWIETEARDRGFKIGEVTAIGLSAGGHLSLLLGCSGAVDKVVSFAAPVNLTDQRAWSAYRETLEALVGSPLETKVELLKAASPQLLVGNQDGEVFLLHGLDDRRIPFDQSLQMSASAAAAGWDVRMRLVPDGGHTVVGGPEAWASILNFLDVPRSVR
jgi:acetyl esterase/lipase